MMNPNKLIILPLTVAAIGSCTGAKNQKDASVSMESQKPNIIYILADDLGYGDLSCYGQKRFQTPNIDRMAREGIRFAQHYAGTAVSAPSRSSLMTGQTTGHTPIRGNKEVAPEGQWPLPNSTFTLAEMLKQAGYITGAFGKWGLGYPGSEGDPNNQGFDEFFGFNCQRLAHNHYPEYLWNNQEKVILEGNSGDGFVQYAPELIHQQALQFIEKHHNEPFFLYYPTTIPHAELLIPEKQMKEYRGKFLPEKSYKGAEPGDKRFRQGAYGTQPEGHAAFAAMVTLLDQQVGEILDKLKELGLDKNTLVIFSSDNGPHLEGGADPDYFDSNGPLKGYKRDLYEGGIREPMIARWPGKIKEGATTDHISAFWDVMPTLAELNGIETPDNIDGISFLPTLLGKGGQQEHAYLYWEFHERGGRQALRKGNWKLVRYEVSDPAKTTTELYDLTSDLGEEHNVAAEHPEIVAELLKLMAGARIPSEVFIEKYRKKREELKLMTIPHKKEGDEGWTKLIQEDAAYASMVAAMDENVGRLLNALVENGLNKNTWVIFTSDNGGLSTLRRKNATTSNGPLRAGKGWCYEGGIRVPLIISGPDIYRPGRISEQLTVSMDFFSTILSLAGIQHKKNDGENLLPVLTNDKSLKRDEIFWHFPHYHGSAWKPGSAIRKSDWKLVTFYEDDRTELFNLKNDPGELNDLSEQFPEKTKELKNQLSKLLNKNNAKFPQSNPDFNP